MYDTVEFLVTSLMIVTSADFIERWKSNYCLTCDIYITQISIRLKKIFVLFILLMKYMT
jgi:hypothetical protein